MRLHRGGRFRTWLGRRFGGDLELGDRVWRRILHLLGALVLVYYLLPPDPLPGLPRWSLLLAALAGVLSVELLRHAASLELPTIRGFEGPRMASYSYFAVALVLAVLLFPEAIAVAVVLTTAFVDPLIGELRRRAAPRAVTVLGPLLVALGLAALALRFVGGWSPPAAVLGAALLAAIAVFVERWRIPYLDDDLTMTVLPGAALALLLLAAPGLPGR